MKRLGWISFATLAGLAVVLVAALWLNATRQLAALESSGRFELQDAASLDAPSQLFAQPLRLRRGAQVGVDALESYLSITRYRRTSSPRVRAGEFHQEGRTYTIGARPFRFAEGVDAGGPFSVTLSTSGRVSEVKDANGERIKQRRLEPPRISAFYGEGSRSRRIARLADLPDHVPNAVLAIEDQRFRDHSGFDPRRIAGAMLANFRAQRVVQGGSTLTQQLVKNLYLTRERSLLRKLEEVPLAMLLERNHSKDEILEAYLNEVYLGQNGAVAIHGFGAAAWHFFGKDAHALDVHEAALLAGMLRGPTLYHPRRSPERARKRRDRVLDQMHEFGVIDLATAETYRQRELGVLELQRLPRSTHYFTDAVRPRIEATFERERLNRDGLEIYTSLDLRLQQLAQDAVERGVARLEEKTGELKRSKEALQAALVAVEPRSGSIVAMVGGRDYGKTQFNRAVDAKRQPGSVFKPIAALAAITPVGNEPPDFTLATVLTDEPLAIPTPEGDWQPANHDKEFRGAVTLRQAIEHSYNVPMINLGMQLGPRRVVRAARRLGISSRLRGVPSLVLGTSEVTLLEITRAYGVLAAEGYRAEARDVIHVRSRQGETLQSYEPAGSHTLPPSHVHLVTSVLEGVINRGTGYGVRARGFTGPVAGKTGTTDEYRDGWFIGYTRDLAVGVWVGFDDGTTLRNSGSRAALPVFADFLIGAVGRGGGRPFRTPMGIERTGVVAAAGHPAGLRCSGEPEEVFLDGTGPVDRCDGWNWFADDPRIKPVVGGDPGRDLPSVAAPPKATRAKRKERRRRGIFHWPPWGRSSDRN